MANTAAQHRSCHARERIALHKTYLRKIQHILLFFFRWNAQDAQPHPEQCIVCNVAPAPLVNALRDIDRPFSQSCKTGFVETVSHHVG